MMNLDKNAIARALNARIDDSYGDDTIVFRFEDSRLQYELQIQPAHGTAMLAFDPTKPIQACPMLEFSFRCSLVDVGISAYCSEGREVAIRFYEGDESQSGLRLTLSWIEEGYWYVWANANANPHVD